MTDKKIDTIYDNYIMMTTHLAQYILLALYITKNLFAVFHG